MTFEEQVYEIVRKIPAGRVSTYGAIAEVLGNPGAARAIGNALHKNPYEGLVPCHRVVNARGELAKHFGFGGADEQQKRLEAEGVEVLAGRVDLRKYGW